MHFLDGAPRHLFFTGKGGVGKTSLSCAAAIRLADAGKCVLLVSTDPASNLDEVLGVELSTTPLAVPGAANLSALNIDPEAAARAYRERVVGPVRGLLPDAAIASIEEQLSGACTVEIAAFDEFAKLLGDAVATREFDHVILDTAPTGHTLRLLELPSAWTGFFDANTAGASCLGPLAGMQAQRALYQATVQALSDPSRTRVVLVARPDLPALREAARTSRELAALGIANQHLVLNGIFKAASPADELAVAIEQRGIRALRAGPPEFELLPRSEVPLQPTALLGVDALRNLGESTPAAPRELEPFSVPTPGTLRALIDEVAASPRGVLMTLGKGGVGKTTVAAAFAVELANRGIPVHLTTTDPAAHVAMAVGDAPANLTVSRIDPIEETRRYVEEVLATAGAGLDAQGRALLEEDLRSPCTEEIAVFRAFARVVAEGEDALVVIDTAPTGHTLLLLDATETYHREVLRQGSKMPESVRQLLPRLRDPAYTRAVLVTLPEATPVHEAAALQQDLRRAGIEPFAWVINQALVGLPTQDPVLWARQAIEAPMIAEVLAQHARRCVVIPWQLEPPVGTRLHQLAARGEPHQELRA